MNIYVRKCLWCGNHCGLCIRGDKAKYNKQCTLCPGPIIITKYLHESESLLSDYTDLTLKEDVEKYCLKMLISFTRSAIRLICGRRVRTISSLQEMDFKLSTLRKVITAMRVLGAMFLLATSIVCLVFLWPKDENDIVTENLLDPVEFIYLALLKQYSLDEDGLNSLLCNACQNDPYHSVSQTRDFVESKYQKFKVDVDSPAAHDFTDVECRTSEKHEIIIVMQCSGDYRLRNVDGTVVSQNYIDHEFWVIEERNKLKLCPRSCFN